VKLKTSTSIKNALNEAYPQVKSVSETPNLDIQLLLAQVMGKSRTWLLAHDEGELSKDEEAQFQSLIAERVRGVPLPYLLGWWEFYGRRFKLSNAVLIPRPETELLVETAIGFIGESSRHRTMADIGTGSGCIAVSLAAEINNLQVFATDKSFDALVMARENAVMHEVANKIQFVQMDLVRGLEGNFDLVCANLPYIPNMDLKELEVSKWEPMLALDGGDDGLQYIRHLLADLPRVVRDGGQALLEIDSKAGSKVSRMVNEYLPHAEINLRQDYSGRDRLVSVRL
jgi:release factor glutamine methyltransferase